MYWKELVTVIWCKFVFDWHIFLLNLQFAKYNQKLLYSTEKKSEIELEIWEEQLSFSKNRSSDMSKMGGGWFTSPLMQYPWSLASLSYYPRRLEDYVYSCTTAKIIPLPQLNVAESLKRAVSHPSSIHSASNSWVFA